MLLNLRHWFTFLTALDFSLQINFFFINDIFLCKLKTSLEACFLRRNSYILADPFLIIKQKQPFADVLPNRHSWKYGNSHRKTSVLKSLLNKVADLKDCSFIKKKLWHTCFHVNISKCLRTAFFIKHLWLLLLNRVKTNLSWSYIKQFVWYNLCDSNWLSNFMAFTL